MQVTFFRFNKGRNDTKQPTGGTELDVRLKEDCSILKPVLILSTPSWEWNYFLIPSFGRYYFVTDYKYLGNQTYQISGTSDAMASFRGDILSSYQWIARAHTGWNEDIIDGFFPSLTAWGIHEKRYRLIPSDASYENGTFIVGVIGKNGGGYGNPVTYFALNWPQMEQLNDYLFDAGSYGSMISDDITKAFFNPMDYLVSCMYYPIKIKNVGNEEPIWFGWVETSIKGTMLNTYVYDLVTNAGNDFMLENNQEYTDFRKLSPYSHYYLYIPIIGWSEVPSTRVRSETMFLGMKLDLITGILTANIYDQKSGIHADDGAVLFSTSGQFGCPLALAQLRMDFTGLLNSVSSAVTSAATLNVGGSVNGIVNAVDALSGDTSMRNSNGCMGLSIEYQNVRWVCHYLKTVDLDATRYGRPVCKYDQINNYSGGFCMCRGTEMELNGAYASEIDDVTGYMNGGFYVN